MYKPCIDIGVGVRVPTRPIVEPPFDTKSDLDKSSNLVDSI